MLLLRVSNFYRKSVGNVIGQTRCIDSNKKCSQQSETALAMSVQLSPKKSSNISSDLGED